jgi:hypothetical protein
LDGEPMNSEKENIIEVLTLSLNILSWLWFIME